MRHCSDPACDRKERLDCFNAMRNRLLAIYCKRHGRSCISIDNNKSRLRLLVL